MNARLAIALLLGTTLTGCPKNQVDDEYPASAPPVQAIALFRQLGPEPGNLCYSPLSLSLAFAMTHEGARGETAKELEKALALADSDTQAWRALTELLPRSDSNLDLTLVNALWLDQGLVPLPAFLDTTSQGYGAALEQVEFGAPEAARMQINQAISTLTQARIPELLPAAAIDENVRLVLTNALYFKAKWARPFDPEKTQEQPFYLDASRSQSVNVPMMKARAKFATLRTDTLKVLEMPYANSTLSMVFILPRPQHELAEVEALLSPEQLEAWLSSLEEDVLDVGIPRFKLETSLSVAEAMRGLGVKRLFDASQAELEGISSAEALYISDSFHSAFVEVDESGSEAAAATAVVSKARSMIKYNSFVADQPFLFLIRERQSGAILFFGRVNEPS